MLIHTLVFCIFQLLHVAVKFLLAIWTRWSRTHPETSDLGKEGKFCLPWAIPGRSCESQDLKGTPWKTSAELSVPSEREENLGR